METGVSIRHGEAVVVRQLSGTWGCVAHQVQAVATGRRGGSGSGFSRER
jgi:hypothetical protein